MSYCPECGKDIGEPAQVSRCGPCVHSQASEIAQLKEEKNSLEFSYRSVRSLYDDLQQQCDSLREQYNHMKDSRDELQVNIDQGQYDTSPIYGHCKVKQLEDGSKELATLLEKAKDDRDSWEMRYYNKSITIRERDKEIKQLKRDIASWERYTKDAPMLAGPRILKEFHDKKVKDFESNLIRTKDKLETAENLIKDLRAASKKRVFQLKRIDAIARDI